MKLTTATGLAALGGVVSAKAPSDSRTFAVLRFNGDELTKGRMDPIVSPGEASQHVHSVMGGSNFGISVTGEELMNSQCSNSKIKGDNSNYWVPSLYFRDPATGLFESVDMYYMNVYYFFEASDDNIEAFPIGLQIVAGNSSTRTVLPGGGGGNLDPSKGPISSVQWTCPRSSSDPPSYPANSDGSMAGIQDPNNQQAGVGFPFENCDGLYSPLRQDIHFPSCYNPDAGLTNYKENMVFPVVTGTQQNCPEGYTHVPHLFYEVYWNTQPYASRWTPGNSEPFVLSSGDVTGFSSHGDFLAAWDVDLLQGIIDNCNAGDSGMDQCSGLTYGLNDPNTPCTIPSAIDEVVNGVGLTALPGDNPLAGWQYGPGTPASSGSGGAPAPSPSSSPANNSPAPADNSPAPADNSPAPADNSPAPADNSPAPEDNSQATPPQGPQPQYDAAQTTASPASSPAPTSAPVEDQFSPAASGNGGGCKANNVKVETIWETTTVWGTTTLHLTGASPTATPSKKMRRHPHNHAVRHRNLR